MDIFNQSRCICGYNVCLHHMIILCVIMVIFYVYLVANYLHNDILEKKVANCSGCDGWAVSHLFFFMTVGFMFPNKLFEVMILGIIWEFFETQMGTLKSSIFKRNVASQTDPNNDVLDTNSMWYGRVSDIAFNLTGAIIGVKLAELMSA